MPKRPQLTERQKAEREIRREANGSEFAPHRKGGLFAERARQQRERLIDDYVARRMVEWDKMHPAQAEAAQAATEVAEAATRATAR